MCDRRCVICALHCIENKSEKSSLKPSPKEVSRALYLPELLFSDFFKKLSDLFLLTCCV